LETTFSNCPFTKELVATGPWANSGDTYSIWIDYFVHYEHTEGSFDYDKWLSFKLRIPNKTLEILDGTQLVVGLYRSSRHNDEEFSDTENELWQMCYPTKEIRVNEVRIPSFCNNNQFWLEIRAAKQLVAKEQDDVGSIKPVMREEFEHLSDFAIETESNHVFRCHKILLANISPVFNVMFQTDKSGEKKKIKIEEFKDQTVENFLTYLYHGKVDHQTADLLVMADKYKVKALVEECINFICSTLTQENIKEVLIASETIKHSAKLKRAVRDFILENWETKAEIPGLNQALKSYPDLLLELVSEAQM